MNPLIYSAFSSITKNKHTSIAGALYALSKFGCPIASNWFPSHKSQIEASAPYLEGLAVWYGLSAAGDAARSASKDDVASVAQAAASAIKSGDTAMLTKPPEQKPNS